MRFLIIALPRTGSSHLVNLLSGHPDIFTNGNVFDGRKTVYVLWPDITPDVRAELIEQRRTAPLEFLERVYTTSYGRSHVGFKIFSGENDEILDRLIRDSDVRKIVLYRRNVLACFSSHLVAGETGKYSEQAGAEHGPAPKVRFRADKFARFHHRFSTYYRDIVERLNKHRQNFQFCSYEEINDPWLLRSMMNFIGADPQIPVSSETQLRHQVKQNTSDILARFLNRKETAKFLRENGLSHWAYEGELSLGPFVPREKTEASESPSEPAVAGQTSART